MDNKIISKVQNLLELAYDCTFLFVENGRFNLKGESIKYLL